MEKLLNFIWLILAYTAVLCETPVKFAISKKTRNGFS